MTEEEKNDFERELGGEIIRVRNGIPRKGKIK